jgi:O-antigen/teichoic acid export membrane protein
MTEQSITTSKRLVYNTAFNVLALVSNALVGFFLIRFFLGRLGEQRYGVWVLIGSLFRYGGIFSMGLSSSINRYVPMSLAKEDRLGVQKITSTSLFFFLCMAVLCVFLSILIYYNVDSWFAIEPELITAAATLVLVVGLCFAIAMPLQLFSAVLAGLQRYDIMNSTILFFLLVRTILLVVLLVQGYGLVTMGLIFGISEILVRVSQVFFVKKLLPIPLFSLSNIDFALLKEMISYGMNTFLYAMGAIIIFKASDLVIGIFIGTSEVTQFAIAAAAVLLLTQLLQAFTRAIMPAVSDLDSRDDRARVKELSFLTQKYSLLLIIPAAFFFVVMGKKFLWVWIGDRFHEPDIINRMAVILAILVVAHSLRLAQHSNFLVLVGRGQHRIFGVLTGLTALICVIASVVSVKVFHWGLIAIAWSNFIPIALISGLLLPVYFNRKMKVSAKEAILSIWWPALLGCLPSLIIISLWNYLAPPDSWLQILSVVVAAAAITLLSSWFLSLMPIERKRFSKILLRSKALT